MQFMIELLTVMLLTTGCFPGFPERDCGAIRNVNVAGIVTNEKSNPLAGATIYIGSQQQNACSGSQPIPEVILVSDAEGRFSTIIPIIYADDVVRIEVSARAFRTRSYDERTYTFFEKELSVVLEQ
jgi:hypothetical protein